MPVLGQETTADQAHPISPPLHDQATDVDGLTANDLFFVALAPHQAGQLHDALAGYERVLALEPNHPEALSNLAGVLHSLGRIDAAVESCQKALMLRPDFAEAYSNLGNAQSSRLRLKEAEACFRHAVAIKSDYAEAYGNLGVALYCHGRRDEAEACMRRAIALKPNYPEAHSNLGNTLYDLGLLEEAEAHYLTALTIKPDYSDAYSNLGNTLYHLDRPEEAAASCHRALTINPASSLAHSNLGLALMGLRQLEAAGESCRLSLTLQPNCAKANTNLAHSRLELGQFEAAKITCHRALAIDPDLDQARLNLAFVQFALGEMTEAWAGYESRWNCVDKGSFSPARPFPQPRWKGEDLRGRKILVWGEQGIGDELVFFALLPEMMERGALCIVEADPRLRPLLSRSLPGVEIIDRSPEPDPRGLAPDIDFQVPIASMAALLRPSLEGFRPLPPYLIADPAVVADFRQAYGGNRLIGISWWSQNRRLGPKYSIPLRQWRPLLETEGCRFISLQYGDRKAEIAESGLPLVVDDSVNPLTDLDRFAAQVTAMDLVISIDNSTVSMAASLGKPIWNLVNTVPEWRIGQTGDTGLWHPTMRLFRQTSPGVWDPVIAKAEAALRQWLGVHESE
ncbi:putative TPR repeat-containing protein [Candidatus Terasakiella magnetica]|nr:putative TPR repeat-containing protein [Candidatus Terasakiella magnetica]